MMSTVEKKELVVSSLESVGNQEAGSLFSRVAFERRSVRTFDPEPLPPAVIIDVLEDAQRSPSNCNTQPWIVHVVSGHSRDLLSERLLAANNAGLAKPDFIFNKSDYAGVCGERAREHGRLYYRKLGIDREDIADRRDAVLSNYRFFGAPHVAFLFMRPVGDGVRVAADMGMYAQTLMLALTARGYGSIPQTALGLNADIVRDMMGLDDELKLLFGISFGKPAESAREAFRTGRDPIARSVTFHD